MQIANVYNELTLNKKRKNIHFRYGNSSKKIPSKMHHLVHTLFYFFEVVISLFSKKKLIDTYVLCNRNNL